MTSSAAFPWLLEKPAAWADEDAPCLAAALMAQRPPCDMQHFRERLHKEAAADTQPRAVRRRAKKASSSPKTSWATALASRKRAWRPLTAADAKKHKKRVKADRKRVQKKFFEAHDIEAPPGEDIAENDAGLPAPARSEQGRFVELWAKFGSWGICKGCRSLQPRRLEPIDCRRVAKPEIAPRACDLRGDPAAAPGAFQGSRSGAPASRH